MAKILVNYIHNKRDDSFIVLDNKGYVLADMDVAVLDTEDTINEPLVVTIQNRPRIVDRKLYEKYNKKFKLIINKDGTVKEDEVGTLVIWLPKDTDLKKLRFINNQIVLVEEEGDDKDGSKRKV